MSNTHIPPLNMIKTQVTATSRKLDANWRLIWPRWHGRRPRNLDLKQFPHKAVAPRNMHFDHIKDWCRHHVGKLDQDWSYEHTGAILFRDATHQVQFTLTFG